MNKQETLEEAAEKEFPLMDTTLCRTGDIEEENFQLLGHRKSFIAGAKWQAERMYSEEDLKSAFFNGGDMKDIEEFNYWLEQFKKKKK
jgi:hypothetical protein